MYHKIPSNRVLVNLLHSGNMVFPVLRRGEKGYAISSISYPSLELREFLARTDAGRELQKLPLEQQDEGHFKAMMDYVQWWNSIVRVSYQITLKSKFGFRNLKDWHKQRNRAIALSVQEQDTV